ncbi:unnamed protein product, partial [Staurois parvus]
SCSLRQELTCSSVQRCSLPTPVSACNVWSHALYCLQSLVITPCTVCSLWSLLYCPQSLFISCTVRSLCSSSPILSTVSGHPLYCPQSLVIPCTVRSLWSSPVLSAVIWSSCTVSTVSGPSPVLCPQSLVHLMYYVRSLWSISCTVSAVSCHLLYYVRSLWSSPVLCPQVSLVISCTVSAVSGHLLYFVRRSLWSSP